MCVFEKYFLGWQKVGFWVEVHEEVFLSGKKGRSEEVWSERGVRVMNVGEGRQEGRGRRGTVDSLLPYIMGVVYMGILDKLFDKHGIKNNLARDLTKPITRFGAKTSFNRAFYRPDFVCQKQNIFLIFWGSISGSIFVVFSASFSSIHSDF